MDQSFFRHYLVKIQGYAASGELTGMIDYIQELQELHKTDSVLFRFLEAESAFYQENYHKALKNYLHARHIPLFHFFCYRTSAHLSFESHHYQKARKYIKKALRIKTDDYPSLKLICQLYMIDEKLEKAQATKNKMAYIKELLSNQSTPHNFSVSEQEVDELSQIMAKCKKDSNTLFAREIEEFNSKFAIDLSPYETKKILNQIKAYKQRAPLKNDFALFFNEFNKCPSKQLCPAATTAPKPKTEFEGGYFIFWKGCGIAINPGNFFLKNLQKHQLFAQDIDIIIITHENALCEAECQRIWQLNLSIEKHEQCERKVAYYINCSALEEMKQIFFSENCTTGQTIIPLAPPTEDEHVSTLQLNGTITLNYFTSNLAKNYTTEPAQRSAFGINLTLNGEQPVKIGYLSKIPWFPYLSQYICDCQLLIAGIGKIDKNDLDNDTFNQEDLGYGGIKRLVKELKTDLILCSEYDLPNSQLLQAMIRNLRNDASPNTTVLAADRGLYIDIPAIHILSSDQQEMLKPPEVKMICLEEAASSIRYCSIKNIL